MRILPATLAVALSAQVCAAATPEGQFAADGIGTQSCANFSAAIDQQEQERLVLYAAWIEGFVTGTNVFREDTFDIAPWQTTGLLMSKMQAYCRANPDTGFVVALVRLVSVLAPDRLTEESPRVEATAGAGTVALPQAVLERVRAALEAETGAAIDTPEGSFGPAFAEALRSYQSEAGLDPTGLPDQATLNTLFP